VAVIGQEKLQQEAVQVINGMENQYPGKAIGDVMILVRVAEPATDETIQVESSNPVLWRRLRDIVRSIVEV
jgi:hypothetical protein